MFFYIPEYQGNLFYSKRNQNALYLASSLWPMLVDQISRKMTTAAYRRLPPKSLEGREETKKGLLVKRAFGLGSDFIFFNYFILFCLFRATPVAYGSSQAKSELQLPACTTATAMPDPSCVYDRHHSSRQCWILNPPKESRDQTRNLMDASQIHFCCTTTGTPWK